MRVRIRPTQGLQRWQGEDEIADRAAADHQNPVHKRTASALSKRRIGSAINS